MEKAPALNEPVLLQFIFSSVLPAPETQATVTLPASAVLHNGSLEWSGNLEPEVPVTLTATISFVAEGSWTIEGKAIHEVGNGDVWADSAYIYLTVSAAAGEFGFPTEPPPPAADDEASTPPAVEPSQ